MPILPKYNLSIEPAEPVEVLKGMGEIIKWPLKMRSLPGVRDTRKWCEFHQDRSLQTDEFHTLYPYVVELFEQGHVKDLLSECDLATRDKDSSAPKDDTPPISPRTDRIINVISGRS